MLQTKTGTVRYPYAAPCQTNVASEGIATYHALETGQIPGHSVRSPAKSLFSCSTMTLLTYVMCFVCIHVMLPAHF